MDLFWFDRVRPDWGLTRIFHRNEAARTPVGLHERWKCGFLDFALRAPLGMTPYKWARRSPSGQGTVAVDHHWAASLHLDGDFAAVEFEPCLLLAVGEEG